MWGFTNQAAGTKASPASGAAGGPAPHDRDELAALGLLPIARAGRGAALFTRDVLTDAGPEFDGRDPGAGHSPAM